MRIVIYILVTLQTACGFSGNKTSSEGKTVDGETVKIESGKVVPRSTNEILFDWGSLDQGTRDKKFKGYRILREVADKRWDSTEPLTLPIESPETLVLKATFQSNQSLLRIKEASAFLKVNDLETKLIAKDIVSEFNEETRLGTVKLNVQGLKSLVPLTKTVKGSISITFFDHDARIVTLSIPVRLPPSNVEVQVLSRKDLRDSKGGDFFPQGSIKIDDARLFVIGGLKIANNEEDPIVVRLPLRTDVRLARTSRDYFVNNVGCFPSRGFVDKEETFSDKMALIPYGSNTLSDIADTFSRPNSNTSQLVTIGPNSVVTLGLIGSGKALTPLFDDKLIGSNVSTVPSVDGCRRVCTSRDSAGGDRGGTFCSGWEDKPVYVDARAGSEKLPIELRGETTVPFKIKYADLPMDRGDEERFSSIVLDWRGL